MTPKTPYKTLLIGSGKGGVGKSTVAVNLAIALANQGLNIGLLDADLYGPSIPVMLGLRKISPRIEQMPDKQEKVIPITKFGIQIISLGFFIEEARSIVWRGPILHAALEKMIYQSAWGKLDLMIVDLPPGTGDTLLSLAQLLKPIGGITVCTPQEAAIVDAIKAINAFDQLEIPLIGIVENMAGFQVPGTDQIHDIFGRGKGKELAGRFQTDLLATIPLFISIRQGGDEGVPCALNQADPAGQHFVGLASIVSNKCLQPIGNPFRQ
jgi:ATP-binding protein involved in chromosome partitioning